MESLGGVLRSKDMKGHRPEPGVLRHFKGTSRDNRVGLCIREEDQVKTGSLSMEVTSKPSTSYIN